MMVIAKNSDTSAPKMAIIGAHTGFESWVGAVFGLFRHRGLSDCRVAIIFGDK
jgi:hypothetical protein